MGSKNKKRKLMFLCAGAGNNKLPEVDVEGLLISVGFDMKSERLIQMTREMIGKAKPKYVMVDSGGYQIYLAEKKGIAMSFDPKLPLTVTNKFLNISPRHVVEKAIEINADSMVALDFPIRKIKDPHEQEREFQKKLHYNVPWAIETAELREKRCPEVNLYIPVQAYTLEQFEEFYEQIKGIDFDGFSLPVRNLPMKEVALFMLKMHTMGVKKVHILGSSSLPTIAICAYMSQRFFETVTFDATSWRIAAQFGTFIWPGDLSCRRLYEVGSYDPNFRCHCQSCQGMTLGQMADLDKIERTRILRTHNFLTIQNVTETFGEASFDVQYLENHLRKSKRRDVKKILSNMTEIEEMCSMSSPRNIRTRNYHDNSRQSNIFI
ncbi:MAG: hypothetical protein WC405_09015 [Syntrophales bacterium]